jgi:hypothetical protein
MFVGNRRTRFRADQVVQTVLTSMMQDRVSTLYHAKIDARTAVCVFILINMKRPWSHCRIKNLTSEQSEIRCTSRALINLLSARVAPDNFMHVSLNLHQPNGVTASFCSSGAAPQQ